MPYLFYNSPKFKDLGSKTKLVETQQQPKTFKSKRLADNEFHKHQP